MQEHTCKHCGDLVTACHTAMIFPGVRTLQGLPGDLFSKPEPVSKIPNPRQHSFPFKNSFVSTYSEIQYNRCVAVRVTAVMAIDVELLLRLKDTCHQLKDIPPTTSNTYLLSARRHTSDHHEDILLTSSKTYFRSPQRLDNHQLENIPPSSSKTYLSPP